MHVAMQSSLGTSVRGASRVKNYSVGRQHRPSAAARRGCAPRRRAGGENPQSDCGVHGQMRLDRARAVSGNCGRLRGIGGVDRADDHEQRRVADLESPGAHVHSPRVGGVQVRQSGHDDG